MSNLDALNGAESDNVLGKIQRYVKRLVLLPHTVAEIVERLRLLEASQEGATASIDTAVQSPPDAAPAEWPREMPVLRADHVKGAVLYADRVDALVAAPRGGTVAEIGVALGDFSEAILRALSPVRFDAFDLFRLHKLEGFWGRSSTEWFQGLPHRAYYERRFAKELAADRMHLYEGDSATLMEEQPDDFYDVIYVDGDHSLMGVRRDAQVATRKLKQNGLLIFNDYVMADHVMQAPYGVVPVVNELCTDHGWQVVYLALQSQMFCDLALRRRDEATTIGQA